MTQDLRESIRPNKSFYNSTDKTVEQSIDGLIYSTANIARFEGYPGIKVVLREDWKKEAQGKDQVALVSGGGSGHEPSHGGFVGKGMLTAAVCGDVFASPGVDAILSTIIQVTGEAGCLLIIKNYTGDRIAFGLAAEKAKEMGLKVEMVIVGDDIALADVAPRGLAGTLFIHKIAGALAGDGTPLEELHGQICPIASSIVSLGVSLSTCTIPGSEGAERIPSGQMEIGLGIHGEPGAATGPILSSKDVVEKMADKLISRLPEKADCALLVNNLGSVSNLEMGVIVNDLMGSRLGNRIRLLIGPGHLMTSLNMNGFSLSAVPIDDKSHQCLSRQVPSVPAWPPAVTPKLTKIPMPNLQEDSFAPSENSLVEKRISAACEALIAAEGMLNGIDREVGDGDTGTTFAKAAKGIKDLLPQLPLDDPQRLSLAIGNSLSKNVGGSSGILLSIFFTAMSHQQGIEKSGWSQSSAKAGLEAMMKYGGAKLGDRTMLDALIPAAAALEQGIPAMVAAAQKGVEATKGISKTSSGRSSYVPEEALKGIPDPGALAIEVILKSWT